MAVTETDFIDGIYSNMGDNVDLEANMEDNYIRVKFRPESEVTEDTILIPYKALHEFNLSRKEDEKQTTLMFDLKNASLKVKTDVIRIALNYSDLEDPLMLLNILNLVKVYNTLDDSYFQSKDIFVNSVEELLDLKLALAPDLKVFSQKIAKYFFGLVKSYSKVAFTPADEHIELPNIFKQLFLLLDLATISSILAKSASFSTDEITYIDNAYIYMSTIISRSNMALDMVEDFYKTQGGEDGNSNQ